MSSVGTIQITRMVRILELVGAVFGIGGALVIALKIQGFEFGWVAFVISSVALTLFAYRIKAWWLLAQQVFFMVTNTIGVWNWLILPALRSGSLAVSGLPF